MANPKLERIPSMRDRVQDTLSAHRNVLVSLLSRFLASFLSPFFFFCFTGSSDFCIGIVEGRYVEQGKGILHPNNLIDELDNIVCDDAARLSLREGPFSEVLKAAHVSLLSFYLVT